MKNLKDSQLSKKNMQKMLGGEEVKVACCCACAYSDKGGSSVMGNFLANDAGGLQSPGCDPMD